MIFFDEQLQEEYKQNDVILSVLSKTTQPDDAKFTSHRWLIESLPKRMIYYYVYGDLLEPTSNRLRILDVGGGYTALSQVLLQNHDYCLLDIMAHDDHELLKAVEASLAKKFWIKSDWYDFGDSGHYDLVVANDLFPNVDQRLTLFLDKYLPICGEIRVSLTYHNTHRWYRVKRIDADEVFHMMAWDGWQVKRVLKKYSAQIHEPKFDLLLRDPRSLFSNNRQVCLVTLRGKGNHL
jgi:hypothetical protein